MSHVRKIKKFELFLRRKLAGILAKTNTARRSTEWRSIDYCKDISISKLTLKTALKNTVVNLKKYRKTNFFANKSAKRKVWWPKNTNMINREPVVVSKKSNKPDQLVPRILDSKR